MIRNDALLHMKKEVCLVCCLSCEMYPIAYRSLDKYFL